MAHKVFTSYHHENDQWDRNKFETLFADYYGVLLVRSVQIGDIDPSLNDFPTPSIITKLPLR